MAQNRKSELEPAISTSEEDEDASDQEGTESEGEEIKPSPATPSVTKNTSAAKKSVVNQTPTLPQDSSSDESQFESETDSESTPERPLKSLEDSSKTSKKPRSEPSASALKPGAGAGAKRPAETDAKDPKRVKQTAAEDEQKKQLFQRLWSEDDEIEILKGIMEFTSKKGIDPLNDMNGFYEFIKNSIHVDFAKNQLAAKVRRLKKKYENNAKKAKGKDRTFSKAHEQKAYDLSKKIWGRKASDEVETEGSVKVNIVAEKMNKIPNLKATSAKANGSEKKYVKPKIERGSPVADRTVEVSPTLVLSEAKDVGGSVSDVKFQDEMLKNGMELIKGDQRKELDDKWRKQRLLEAEVYMKRLDLAREQTALVIEALKSHP